MSADDAGVGAPLESAEELFERAPCGYVACLPDGTIRRANATLEGWLQVPRGALAGRRFQELLTAGGRIYHETHYAPLLAMEGEAREIALEIVRADGSRLPVLVNSVLERDAAGEPLHIRTIVFEASERRRYEQELLAASRREHAVALELQRSLLAGDAPTDPAFVLERAYQPADTGLEVGGDWYDAFWVDEGRRLALVVGDIVGRGLQAATTMGQLRSVTRALAGTGLGPAAVLEGLDGYRVRHGVGDSATVVYVELDLSDGGLRYACAGHPPPVLVTPDDRGTLLWDGRSTPIGLPPLTRPRGEGTATMGRGATLVLYTDGLYERRDEPLDAGLERLAQTAGDQAASTPADLVAAVMRTMLAQRRLPDDVCLLALRRT